MVREILRMKYPGSGDSQRQKQAIQQLMKQKITKADITDSFVSCDIRAKQ